MPPMIMNGNSSSLSDNSESSSDDKSPEKVGDDICRDFLRNVCKRGKRCKYRHPNPVEAKELSRQFEYTFCHDYQNSGCRRPSCKFIHCTRDEEDYYKQTGQLPTRLQQAVALGIGVVPKELPLLKGEVPVCRDFMKGECKRGARCKFRHVSTSPQHPQYELDLAQKERQPAPTATTINNNNNTLHGKYEAFTEELERYDFDQLTVKRRRTDYETYLDTFTVRTSTDYRLLEEENALLRRKVEELKKQVSDLAATNEVLLEQNARYRVSKASVATPGPPIVTVSHMVTPTITPAPIVARPTLAAPQPLSILTTTLTEPLTVNANNELMVSHQALQSRLQAAPELQAQQTTLAQAQGAINPAVSVSMVPVSLATADSAMTRPATMAPPGSMAPGSMAPVSMAQPPQLQQPPPPPNVTLAQTTPAGGPGNLMSGPNTALVSYPIMSHTQLPNSSLGNTLGNTMG